MSQARSTPSAPVAVATAESFELGEGPAWDGPRERLLWVDIIAGEICEGTLHHGRIAVVRRTVLGEMAGAVIPAEAGGVLVAGQERLWILPAPGAPALDLPEDGGHAAVPGPRIVPAGERRRLNDGTTDPAGRFLVGTLALAGASDREQLIRLEPDGALTVLDDDLGLSNGLAWSADGTRMFSTDTARGRIWVRDYDAVTGATGPRTPYIAFGDALPDGITVDAEDHLWVALWGSGEVRRYAPDGSSFGRVSVPAPHVSSVAFAGPDLRTLVITTARDQLTPEQLRDFPNSGRIFTALAPVPGLPDVPWSGASGFGHRDGRGGDG